MNIKKLIVYSLFPCVAAFSGCASTGNYHTSRGAALGTGLGAATGAIIGHQSGNAGAGALIGAAAGAVGGGLVGKVRDTEDQRDAAVAQAAYLEHQQNALSNSDVVMMSQNQIGDQVIISSIQSRGGRFDLSPQGLITLKQSGVSDSVLQYMQTNGQNAAGVPTIVQAGPRVVSPAPVVIVEPAPVMPSPHVGLVFDFHRHGPRHRYRHHRWHH
ncbi:YMGG-like glycine zipper-containing protein [Polystyrenella longa]|nr:glycine zipper domain-containing protein [Polystyrenella longa]